MNKSLLQHQSRQGGTDAGLRTLDKEAPGLRPGESLLKKQLADIPGKPGVYLFRDKKENIIYIGKAANLKKRIQSHFKKNSPFLKEELLIASTVKIDCLETGKELNAFLLENELIKKHQPKFNVKLRDDKTYPYLAVSREDIPRVFIARKKTLSADFFGPFPKTKLLKQELRLLRRLFPFRSCRRVLKKPCLYKDLNLCFCRRYSAGALVAVLGKGRIEGYDISNISGKMATGSMVVFIDGKPAKDQYRQFKIKTKFTPDDPAMIKEVLSRRLAHREWDAPSLIIVDGGEGQLNAAIAALKKTNQKIPTIALAKKEEEIYYPSTSPDVTSGRIRGFGPEGPHKNGKGETAKLKLPPFSLFLPLLQRIRDEAHRFALRYHHKLRQKETLRK